MNHTKERIKTILLIVLICGAVFLTYTTWFYDNPLGRGAFFSLFSDPAGGGGGQGADTTIQPTGTLAEIKPLRACVNTGAGRYGAEYNPTAVDELFGRTRGLVAEAISTAGEWFSSTEKSWREALGERGVLYDYQGVVRLDALALWLRASGLAPTNARGRYLLVATDPDGERVTLYLKNPYSGDIYACVTGMQPDVLLQGIAGLPTNQLKLAFELADTEYAKLAPETFVHQEPVKPPVVNGYNYASYLTEEQEKQFLKCFGFHSYSVSQYNELDGTKVYIENISTIKVAPDGFVTYTDTRPEGDTQGGLYVQSAAETPTQAEILETARMLISRLAALVPGEGRLYVQDYDYFEEDQSSVVVFGWSVGGIPVDRQQTGYTARVIIRNRRVVEACFYMRSYESAGRDAAVLSQKLAAAAAPAGQSLCELELRYTDAGQSELSPDWYMKQKP